MRLGSSPINPSTLGGQGGQIVLSSGVQDQPGQHGKTLSPLKIQKLAGLQAAEGLKKIRWVLWYAPVIPATQEAETGELLEPTRQRSQ